MYSASSRESIHQVLSKKKKTQFIFYNAILSVVCPHIKLDLGMAERQIISAGLSYAKVDNISILITSIFIRTCIYFPSAS